MADSSDKTNEDNTIKICSGIVKAVTSGNRLIIREPSPKAGKYPLEKVVVLQYVTCPEPAKQITDRTTKIENTTTDSNGAWECREFVRNMLVGKSVYFSIGYSWDNINQVSGNVWLENEKPGKDHGLAEKGLAAGWFRISDNYRAPQYMKDLEIEAQNNNLGLYDNTKIYRPRDITWKLDAKECVALVKRNAKKRLRAQVEFVLSGSTLKVYLLDEQTYFIMQLTGVRCNSLSAQNPDDRVFSQEAKLFVESRLLNREVECVLDYADPPEGQAPGRICGSLIHPKGNISELLLQEGLAKCADWSIKYYTAGPVDTLRKAQNQAKANRKRLWVDYKAPTEGLGSDLTYNAIVKQIITTDTIIVRKTESKEDVRLTLSSVRAINKNDFNDSWKAKIAEVEKQKQIQKLQFSPVLDMPVNFEAKEFIRKKLISQRVKISIDYKQEARAVELNGKTVNYPERLCATVMYGDTNIAEAMAQRGYVKVITHSASDDKRSSRYDSLTQAELKAVSGKKGIWDNKLSLPRIIEVNGKQMASPFFTQYSRQDRVKVVVDYVFSANRLKCYVPKDNINIMVIIAGMEAPRVGIMKQGVREPSEPFALEGMAYTRDKIMQCEVDLKCVGQDKHGSFIGYIYDQNMNNVAVGLLQEGLAKVHDSAYRHNFAIDSLLSAETKAKTARKNLWKNWSEEDDVEVAEANTYSAAPAKKEPYSALISDVRRPTEAEPTAITIAVQAGESAESNCGQIQTLLGQEMKENPPLTGSVKPKRGEVLVAKWPADDQWYRAKVDKINNTDREITVTFIDYGNQDTFKFTDRVGKLPATVDQSVFAAQSKLVTLAMVEFPKNADYVETVFGALSDELLNHKVQVQVKFNFRGQDLVTLSEDGTDPLIALLEQGELMAAEKPPRDFKEDWKVYDRAMQKGIRDHKNIWRWGDIRGEE